MKHLIWDLPTRLFHWLFAFSVGGAFLLAKVTEKETPLFYLHVVLAVLAACLLIWRVVWGFIGSRHARFKSLLFSPQETISYFIEVFKGKGLYHAGHNPGGAIVVLKIMGATFLTIVSGVFIAQSEFFEEAHEILPVITMILVGIHIAGVLMATKMNGENYALSMMTGLKRASPEEALNHSHRGAALILLVVVLGPWLYFVKGFDRNTALFTAPGTQWTFQVGEPEYSEEQESEKDKAGHGDEEEGDHESLEIEDAD